MCLFFLSPVVLGPSPSRTLRSHGLTCSMLFLFFPAVVWAQLKGTISDHIVVRVQCLLFLFSRSESSMCSVLLFVFPVIALGPPPTQILRSHSSTCSMRFRVSLVVVLGPPSSQVLRSQSCKCSIFCSFLLSLFCAHLQANLSNHIFNVFFFFSCRCFGATSKPNIETHLFNESVPFVCRCFGRTSR